MRARDWTTPMIRLAGDSRLVGGDGLFAFASGFQCVTTRGEGRRIAGKHFQHAVKGSERALVVTGLHRLDGVMGQEDRIGRILVVQVLRLFQRSGEFLTLAKHLNEVQPHLDIVRLKLQRAFQQNLGIIIDVEAHEDGKCAARRARRNRQNCWRQGR